MPVPVKIEHEELFVSQTTPLHPERMQGVPVAAVDPLERETIRRVAWRLIPLLGLSYFCAYLDRVNVGFAALTMNKALGFSSAVFGFGAGVLYISYIGAEIPSNLILAKIGARRWIARILFTWGIISGCMAFVWNDWSFYGIRFLLGLAEAGFMPGAVFYMTWWFPARYRARMLAIFLTAQTFSMIIGPIVSAWLLSLDGAFGLQGWQLLFVAEAIPALVMSVVVWTLLTDRPWEAAWLRPEQREWLQRELDAEVARSVAVHRYSLREALLSGRLWLLTLAFIGYSTGNATVALFLPQIVRALGVSIRTTGFIAALPYVFGLGAMLWWSVHSDRTGRRTGYAATVCLTTGVALAVSGLLGPGHPVLMIAAITVAVMSLQSFAPMFWPVPMAMLSGLAAAGGLGLINSVGNVSGLVGPWMFGLIKDATGGSDRLSLLVLSAAPLISAIILVALGRDQRVKLAERP
jgi:MFS family permease